MRFEVIARFLVGLCFLFVLDGCGMSGNTTTAGGGSGGTGISAGSVTAFGSIFVNGVEFETGKAAFTVDGRPAASQNDLAIGMVVTVKGSFSGTAGNAVTVAYRDVVEGFVDQKVNANTLLVMGQAVEVDEKTKYRNVTGIDQINVGDILEISGFVKGPGLVAASFVKKKTTLPIDYEIHGFVSAHDPLGKTFTIGALTVNYAGASVVNGLPLNGSWNGQLLAVTGDSYNPVSGTLNATAVQTEDNGANGANEAEVEGYVTALQGANSFSIGTFVVQTDNATRYEDGTAVDLVLGAYIEVEGSVVGGVIHADEIQFKNKVRVEASVASVDAGAGTLTFYGLSGMTVTVNPLTDYNNARSLADVAVGNYVRITGRALATAPGSVLATLVGWEANAPTPEPKLRGPLTVDPVDPIVTVLGVSIDTSGWADSRFKGAASGRNAFFAMARANHIVHLNGKGVGNSVTWDSIELK